MTKLQDRFHFTKTGPKSAQMASLPAKPDAPKKLSDTSKAVVLHNVGLVTRAMPGAVPTSRAEGFALVIQQFGGGICEPSAAPRTSPAGTDEAPTRPSTRATSSKVTPHARQTSFLVLRFALFACNDRLFMVACCFVVTAHSTPAPSLAPAPRQLAAPAKTPGKRSTHQHAQSLETKASRALPQSLTVEAVDSEPVEMPRIQPVRIEDIEDSGTHNEKRYPAEPIASDVTTPVQTEVKAEPLPPVEHEREADTVSSNAPAVEPPAAAPLQTVRTVDGAEYAAQAYLAQLQLVKSVEQHQAGAQHHELLASNENDKVVHFIEASQCAANQAQACLDNAQQLRHPASSPTVAPADLEAQAQQFEYRAEQFRQIAVMHSEEAMRRQDIVRHHQAQAELAKDQAARAEQQLQTPVQAIA